MKSNETGKLSCLAIGDFLIPSKVFDSVLNHDALFSEYQSLDWQQGLNGTRAQFRDVVRRIETYGTQAYTIQNDIVDRIKNVDVLFVHLCPISAELISRANKLKYIMVARGGLENIDLQAANEKHITVINCPEHNALAVAEYTVGLMICEMRNIVRSDIALREGIWREFYDNTSAIPELNGSTIGLIGFGTIGKLVAERILPFGAKVMVYDPYIDQEIIKNNGLIPTSKEVLLKQCDIVSLHGRLPNNAPPIIGKKELSIMKKNSLLINTARASLVDMDALGDALRNKMIMGAALDVFNNEPLPKDFPFLKLDNITITNHRGGDTLNSYLRAPELLLNKLRKNICLY